jgi:hypothetical protein
MNIHHQIVVLGVFSVVMMKVPPVAEKFLRTGRYSLVALEESKTEDHRATLRQAQRQRRKEREKAKVTIAFAVSEDQWMPYESPASSHSCVAWHSNILADSTTHTRSKISKEKQSVQEPMLFHQ